LAKDSEVLRYEALDRKITLATEGFGNTKFCEIGLRDRNRLSKENALTICEYVIAMKREINPRLSYIKNTIQFLAELSKSVEIEIKFIDMKGQYSLLFRQMSQARNRRPIA